MKICFVGDIFLGGDLSRKSVFRLVENAIFNEADIIIGNLEGPISGVIRNSEKSALVASERAPSQLRELGVFAVGLANNHLQDGGDEGIISTLEKLESANIHSFGAGLELSSAGKPLWLNQKIAVLGYCDSNKPHLSQVQVASDRQPGVNPLSFNKVVSDLKELPPDTRVILFLHWGREHVWVPPLEDLTLAKKLLLDDRILGIVGMHCHRVQGVVNNGHKRAYMSLGNFIFPDFYVAPRNRLVDLNDDEKRHVKYRTNSYHTVFHITKKCWPLINRVSLVVGFDTEKLLFTEQLVIQNAETGEVTDLKGVLYFAFKLFFRFLSFTNKTPEVIYRILLRPYYLQSKIKRRFAIRLNQLKQLGIYNFSAKVLDHARNR